MKDRVGYLLWALIALFLLGLIISKQLAYQPGIQAGKSFLDVIAHMLCILPCAFLLIALFEQWVRQETVERHLGEEGGLRGYLWAMLLGAISVGGLYVAFPLACSLRKKGASLEVVFVYLACAGICRIPMTLFEISFLGLPFTALRLGVAIPLALLSGILLGRFLRRQHYQLRR